MAGAAGIVIQGTGRHAASQALSSARIAWTGTVSARQRIGVSVFAVGAIAYYKIYGKSEDISAVVVSSTNAEGAVPSGLSAVIPVDANSELVITGTVVAVELLGTYD